MKISIITGVFVGLLGTSGFADAADLSPKMKKCRAQPELVAYSLFRDLPSGWQQTVPRIAPETGSP